MSERRIGFGGELEALRAENAQLRAALRAYTEFVRDEDGAARLRSEPNGPAYCQGCLTQGRLVRLILQQGGAAYYCQVCDRRWLRPTRERAYMQAITDANASAFTDFDPPLC